MTQLHGSNGRQTSDLFIDLRRNPAGPTAGLMRDGAFQTVQTRSRHRPIWISLDVFALDGFYAFCLFTAALFVQQAGTLSGLAMAALPLLYMAIRRRVFGQVMATRWPILIVPLFCLASTAWSEDPGVSAKYGAEMWLTAAAGIALGVASKPTAVLKGACAAFAVYIAASVVLGRSIGIGVGGGGEAFVGLGDGKNLLADIASTGVLISVSTLFVSLRPKHAPWAVLAFFAAAMEAYIMVQARSAGAILALSGGLVALLGLMMLSMLPRGLRIGSIVMTLLSAAVFGAAVRNVAGMLIGLGAEMFDKDPTLTGRTYLWYRANDLIAEKPWLGRGFYAFWRQGNTDAEGLWQYAGILGRQGFNFHNTLIELLVQVGVVGAGVFAMVALIGLLSLVRQFIERPSLPVCFWLAYMIYVGIRTPMEAVGYAPFYFSTCLLFAAAARGLQPLVKRVKSPIAYWPQAVRLQTFYDARRARQGSGQALA